MLKLLGAGTKCNFWNLSPNELNIQWNCLYWSTFLYIIIAQWSRALVLWTADPEFKSAGDFCYWNKFLKVIFLPKMIFHLLFVHSYLSYVTSFFIIKLFRLDSRNFIQVWWATFNLPNLVEIGPVVMDEDF